MRPTCRRRALLLTLLCAAPAAAQEGRPCTLEFRGVTRAGRVTTSMRVFSNPDGSKRTYISGGVDATCAGQGNRLLADSAEHYGDRGQLVLIRAVRYTDPKVRMTSDRMVYYTSEERLHATGSVDGTTSGGTRFRGPEMTYLRPHEGIRTVASWRAPGRPTVRLSPRPTAGAAPATAPDTMTVIGDVVFSENDSLVWAVGKVILRRTDLDATADSARVDQGREVAHLRRDPRIVGTGERRFTMVATEIDLWSRDERLERVRGDGAGRIDADSTILRGDTLDLRLVDQVMDRVYAWGGRASVDGPRQQMEADSFDIRLPGQTLEELHAVGRATARATPDTAEIRTGAPDWITGDTLVATFETVTPAGDTTKTTRMRSVIATGAARAFQQVAVRDADPATPNLSYSRGKRITVTFAEGAMRDVAVDGEASGLYLEVAKPAADSTRVPGRLPSRGRVP